MLIVYLNNSPTQARFNSWTELLSKWGSIFGHGRYTDVQVRKGIQGKILVQGDKTSVLAHARDMAESESDTGYYQSVASLRSRARSTRYERGTSAFRALFA